MYDPVSIAVIFLDTVISSARYPKKRGADKEKRKGWDSLSVTFFWAQLILHQGVQLLQVQKSLRNICGSARNCFIDSLPAGKELEVPVCIKGDHTLLLGKSSSRNKVLCEFYWKALYYSPEVMTTYGTDINCSSFSVLLIQHCTGVSESNGGIDKSIITP